MHFQGFDPKTLVPSEHYIKSLLYVKYLSHTFAFTVLHVYLSHLSFSRHRFSAEFLIMSVCVK
jgi:hypothetical protein